MDKYDASEAPNESGEESAVVEEVNQDIEGLPSTHDCRCLADEYSVLCQDSQAATFRAANKLQDAVDGLTNRIAGVSAVSSPLPL